MSVLYKALKANNKEESFKFRVNIQALINTQKNIKVTLYTLLNEVLIYDRETRVCTCYILKNFYDMLVLVLDNYWISRQEQGQIIVIEQTERR